MAGKQLHYFNLNGLGESIRYILHYTKQDFDDVRHEVESWHKNKIRDTLPYGSLPVYKEDDRTLHQSLAIAKYVARDTDLIPKEPWYQAVLDSAVYTLYDFWQPVQRYLEENDPKKKAELKKKLLDETIDFYLSRIDKQLKENGGFFTGKLSWAEFILVGIIEAVSLVLEVEVAANFPAIVAVVKMVTNLPGVKEYIDKRIPYKPVTIVKHC